MCFSPALALIHLENSLSVSASINHRLALSSPTVRADSAESCEVSLRQTGSVRADCWLVAE